MNDEKMIFESLPNILYKYRDWDDENHKRLLTEGELYFPSFDQFNDPFDGTIPYRYDPKFLTEDNIFLKYLKMTEEAHPTWNDMQIHEECYKYQNEGFLKDDKHLEELSNDLHREMNEKFGIVCLTKKRDDHLMWSHYAKSHTGYCVGLNKNLLVKTVGQEIYFEPIIYQEELPLINLFEDYKKHYRKLLYTKSTCWKYEEEYRLVKYQGAKNLKFPPEILNEIILGCKMRPENKKDIIDIVKNNFLSAKIFDTKLNKDFFKIDVEQIY